MAHSSKGTRSLVVGMMSLQAVRHRPWQGRVWQFSLSLGTQGAECEQEVRRSYTALRPNPSGSPSGKAPEGPTQPSTAPPTPVPVMDTYPKGRNTRNGLGGSCADVHVCVRVSEGPPGCSTQQQWTGVCVSLACYSLGFWQWPSWWA